MNGKKLERENLFAAVWARPMTKVACDYGISDVALKKICTRMEIPTPPRGYWRRRELGYKMSIPKLPKLSAKGVDFVHITGNTGPLVTGAEPDGLPELDDIRHQLATAGHSEPHPLTAQLRTSLNAGGIDERQVIKPRAKRASFISVSRAAAERTVAFLDALLASFDTAGLSVSVDQAKTPVLRIRVEDEEIGLSVTEKIYRKNHVKTEAERHMREYWRIPRYNYIPSGLLTLELHASVPYKTRTSWSDGKRQRLENLTSEIIRGTIAVAKAQAQKRIDDEKARLEAAERHRQWEEAEDRRRREAQQAKHLAKMATQWAEAQRLREFIAEVEACQAGLQNIEVHGMTISEWLAAARQYADTADPLQNAAWWDIDKQVPIWEIR